MNKINWDPLKHFLTWLGVVVLTFAYIMLLMLILSFIFMRELDWTIATMLKWSIIGACVAAIVYPIYANSKFSRKSHEADEKNKWSDWHKAK